MVTSLVYIAVNYGVYDTAFQFKRDDGCLRSGEAA